MSDGGENNPLGSNNQGVNVIINDKLGWGILVAILALVILLFLTDRSASRAELKANTALKSSEDLQTEHRVTQLYLQRVVASCERAGVQAPDIPAALMK